MTMEQPPTAEELLAGHVLGDLDPQEQEQYNQLLRENPPLAQEIERLQETLNLLPYTLPEEASPPMLLKAKILAAAQSGPPLPRIAPNQPQRNFWPWIGSIAAGIAVILGWDSYRLRQELATVQDQLAQQQSLLQDSNTKLVSFKATGDTMQPTGNLLFAPKDQVAVLTLKDIKPLPPSQVYRLWAITDGKKILCGDFSPDTQGKVSLRIRLTPKLAGATLAVTLEPAEKLPQPTGPIVLVSRS